MTNWIKRGVVLLIIGLVVSSCSFGGSTLAITTPVPTAGVAVTTPNTHITASSTPSNDTSVPTAGVAVASPHNSQTFRIDKRAKSERSALKNVELVLYRAEIADDSVTLRVGFQNVTDKNYTITGGPDGNDAVLKDAAGTSYEPSTVSASLNGIGPADGFSRGGANVGTISFPRPTGNAPYEFMFPSYESIRFSLDTPFTATAPLKPGTYAVNANARSQINALSKIELRVQSVEVTDANVVVTVAFANTGRQGYDLITGPDGGDAWLLDAEGQQYQPSAVSDSLESSIAPEGGWTPGQENVGTITFPHPDADSTLRFVFPEYDAISMRFADNKLAEAQVTSPSGGAPQPTATPGPGEATFAAIQQLLAQQSAAVQAGDADAYLATFAPALQDEQRALLERITQAPLVSYTVQLAPDENINDSQGDQLSRLVVETSYALRGINPGNTFLHEAKYSFTRTDGAWRISEIDPGENPPFWQLGNLVVRETPHFLIFARPDTESELPALEQEAEQAYSALQQRGLPLEPRYVAYFTATTDEFRALTGRPASRYLGLALSRYEFNGDQITTTSRAFYINGAIFADKVEQIAPGERQTTITHEIVHLALAAETRPFTPPWLSEGTAVFFSEDTGPAQRQRLLDSGLLDSITLPQLTAANALGDHDLTGQRVGAEYAFSGETIAYLVQTFGEDKMLEFYRSYAAMPAADVRDKMPRFGGSFASGAVFSDLSKTLTEQAVQQFFGRSIAQLDADVKTWIRQS